MTPAPFSCDQCGERVRPPAIVLGGPRAPCSRTARGPPRRIRAASPSTCRSRTRILRGGQATRFRPVHRHFVSSSVSGICGLLCCLDPLFGPIPNPTWSPRRRLAHARVPAEVRPDDVCSDEQAGLSQGPEREAKRWSPEGAITVERARACGRGTGGWPLRFRAPFRVHLRPVREAGPSPGSPGPRRGARCRPAPARESTTAGPRLA